MGRAPSSARSHVGEGRRGASGAGTSCGRGEAKRPRAAFNALDGAGFVAYRQRRWPYCRLLWTAGLAVLEKIGPDSEDMARVLRNLGSLAQEQSDLAAAKEYHRRSLKLE